MVQSWHSKMERPGRCSLIIIIIIIIIIISWDDDYTIAQWLEHRRIQARVPGSSPGSDTDSHFFLQTFPVCLFPSNQLIFFDLGLPAC